MKIYIPVWVAKECSVVSLMDGYMTRAEAVEAIELQVTSAENYRPLDRPATRVERKDSKETRVWVLYYNDDVLGMWQLWVRSLLGSPLEALAECAE